MGDTHDVSYDAETQALLEKIHDIAERYKSLFDARVTQQPLGLLHMAEMLAHLPDARLHAFPEHANQWKRVLDQHMTVLAELTQMHHRGVEEIQQNDSEAGRRLREQEN